VQNDWRTLKCGTHDLAQCLGLTTIHSVQVILVLKTVSIGAELLLPHPDGSCPSQPLSLDACGLTLESIGFNLPLAAAYRTTQFAVKNS
jgi:hypothetical protein